MGGRRCASRQLFGNQIAAQSELSPLHRSLSTDRANRLAQAKNRPPEKWLSKPPREGYAPPTTFRFSICDAFARPVATYLIAPISAKETITIPPQDRYDFPSYRAQGDLKSLGWSVEIYVRSSAHDRLASRSCNHAGRWRTDPFAGQPDRPTTAISHRLQQP